MENETSETVSPAEDVPNCTTTTTIPQDTPSDILFDNAVVDMCMHPSQNWFAAGGIDGEVSIWSFSIEDGNHKITDFKPHKSSCRAVSFSSSGDLLFTASKDKSIRTHDVNTGRLKHKIIKAHASSIYSMTVISDVCLATGDEDGTVKIWDQRTRQAVMDIKEMNEFVSSLRAIQDNKLLLATSGEGVLTVFNVRGRTLKEQSEAYDYEFLCSEVVKGGRKVAIGCSNGAISFFNKNEWNGINDSFPGYSTSIDNMVKVTESIVCTAADDGRIRAVNILPNRYIGMIGEHESRMPILSLALTEDRKLLASSSYDNTVKFWNVDFLKDQKVSDKRKAKRHTRNKHLPSAKHENFFADLTF